MGLPVSARVQQKIKDPDDVYFEIKDSEERRKKQDSSFKCLAASRRAFAASRAS